ncbi:MAG: hypothetical protein DMD95_21890 [Candidatus Rokuibacteriota bacterium]|nr:MAG: hypothetical protein DMD95_21890 [Candidatus Rokubacteria bacterium]
MEISGHRTRSIFDRYNITSEDDLREAMQRTSDYVGTQATRSTVTPIRPAAAGVASEIGESGASFRRAPSPNAS